MALTKYTWNSFNVTPVASKVIGWNSDADGLTTMSGGAWTLIKTITASSDSDIAFVNGSSDVVLDGTYSVYKFEFINIHPGTDDKFFQFNGSDDTSSHSYNITKTTTFFEAEHTENDTTAAMQYTASFDLAQSTNYQRLFNGIGNDNDQCASGYLYLFEPSSTTFVKHFMGRMTGNRHADSCGDYWYAGYFNTTAAITAINFQQSSGNIDTGQIKLYGLEK